MSALDYWVCEAVPRPGRKDRKRVHALGACATPDDAFEAAHIWLRLVTQEKAPASLAYLSAPEVYALIDDAGNVYDLCDERVEYW